MKQIRQSKPRVDLTGQLFGNLKPLYYIKGGKWHCQCQCENKTELDVDTRNLNSGHTQSCGCLQKQRASQNTVDMNDYEDDNIKVLQRQGSDKQGIALWQCICKHCGNVFITRGSNIRNQDTQSCGCIHSNNEKNIIRLLTQHNIEFATQYTFSDLVGENGGHLRFDFAIFHNGILSHLIEYNGLQHYQCPKGKWGEAYETLIHHDEIKLRYCQEHNIELRIIKYDQKYTIDDLI